MKVVRLSSNIAKSGISSRPNQIELVTLIVEHLSIGQTIVEHREIHKTELAKSVSKRM